MVSFQKAFLIFTIVLLTLLNCSNLVLGKWEWIGCEYYEEPLSYSIPKVDCDTICLDLCWKDYTTTAKKCLPYKQTEAICQCCITCYRPLNRATPMAECQKDCAGRCSNYGTKEHRCLKYKVDEGICECC